jgi:hypothetical protein
MVECMSTEAGLLERHSDKVAGVLGGCDRIVLPGTLTAIAHPDAMPAELRREGIRCFDLSNYVEPLREQIRANAERITSEHRLTGPDGPAPRRARRRSSRTSWPNGGESLDWSASSRRWRPARSMFRGMTRPADGPA